MNARIVNSSGLRAASSSSCGIIWNIPVMIRSIQYQSNDVKFHALWTMTADIRCAQSDPTVISHTFRMSSFEWGALGNGDRKTKCQLDVVRFDHVYRARILVMQNTHTLRAEGNNPKCFFFHDCFLTVSCVSTRDGGDTDLRDIESRYENTRSLSSLSPHPIVCELYEHTTVVDFGMRLRITACSMHDRRNAEQKFDKIVFLYILFVNEIYFMSVCYSTYCLNIAANRV